MSDAGDEIQVDAPAEVETVAQDAPKGKMSVEDALQVKIYSLPSCRMYCILTFIYSKS